MTDEPIPVGNILFDLFPERDGQDRHDWADKMAAAVPAPKPPAERPKEKEPER